MAKFGIVLQRNDLAHSRHLRIEQHDAALDESGEVRKVVMYYFSSRTVIDVQIPVSHAIDGFASLYASYAAFPSSLSILIPLIRWFGRW